MHLQFSCQSGCTRCCDTQGYVYLSEEDHMRIAAHLGMTPDVFERRHLYRTRYLRRLRKPADRQCMFLEGDGCSIHTVKPVQCRVFPFWPEYVQSRREWKRVAKSCPGIGQGALVQIGTAMEIAAEMEHAYPSMYGAKDIEK